MCLLFRGVYFSLVEKTLQLRLVFSRPFSPYLLLRLSLWRKPMSSCVMRMASLATYDWMLERLGFSFCNGGCFKVLLLRVYSTSWPWSQDAYQLGRLARQRWSHHNHKTPLTPSPQVYKITGVKMCSLRGYQPDEERVVEITKLLTSGAGFFSWSHQGPSHTIDLTMAAQKIHR